MTREIKPEEKRALREVMDKIIKSDKPLSELEEDARKWLREAASSANAELKEASDERA